MDAITPSMLAKSRIEEESRKIFALAGKKNKGLETGTVIFAFLYKNGIVIGADRQVTGGYKIVRTNFPKIFKISSRSAISFCGSVVMAQTISRVYSNILAEIKFRIEEEVYVPGQIKIFEGIMEKLSFLFDYDIGTMFHFLGVDQNGKPYLLEFYDDGAIVKPDSPLIADGSGGTEARTTLKNFFADKDFRKLELEEALRVAVNTVRVSAEADAGVGDPRLQSATLAVIDAKKGFYFVEQEKVKELIKEVCR